MLGVSLGGLTAENPLAEVRRVPFTRLATAWDALDQVAEIARGFLDGTGPHMD